MHTLRVASNQYRTASHLPVAPTLWPCWCNTDFLAVCRRKRGTDRGVPPTAGLLGRKQDCKHIGTCSVYISLYYTEAMYNGLYTKKGPAKGNNVHPDSSAAKHRQASTVRVALYSVLQAYCRAVLSHIDIWKVTFPSGPAAVMASASYRRSLC